MINLGDTGLIEIIVSLINTLLGLLGVAALLMIVYSGFLIMASGSDEDKKKKGYRSMMNAVVGIILILSAFILVTFLFNNISTATGV